MYPRNKPLRLSMSISVFCVFLAACGGEVSPPELANKSEVDNKLSSTSANKKTSGIVLDTLKAFPTAEGAGAGASGGRGGQVVYVTNKNKTGPGSLYEALSANYDSHRTIMFAVGGEFVIDDDVLKLYGTGNFTIAGQTANDIGGVHLVSKNGGSLFINSGDNAIVRYVSSKGGWDGGLKAVERYTAFAMYNSTNMIFDHWSGGFAPYLAKWGGFNRKTRKQGSITLQYGLGHEGVATHNVGYVWGEYMRFLERDWDSGALDAYHNDFGEVDIHHNAYIMLTHRQTGNLYGSATAKSRRVNNYIYGWSSRLDSHVGRAQIDYVNNVYEQNSAGPDGFRNLHKFEISYATQPTGESIQTSWHFSGNKIINKNGSELLSPKNADDQWKMVRMKLDNSINTSVEDDAIHGLSTGDAVPKIAPYYRGTPLASSVFEIEKTPTDQVKDYVLANAGAGVRFNDDGSTYNVDTVDLMYINYALTGKGVPDHHSSSRGDGGIGDELRMTFRSNATNSGRVNLESFDKDRDGLPDAWEKKHKVTEANSTKLDWIIQGYTIKNNAGYSNLEMYLAEIAGDFHMLAKK